VYPIIDVLNYDVQLQRAFEYVCGSTLVADTLEQARKLAFDGETRRRVVTVDGSMISKSGLMTGGTSASGKSAKNAKRWVGFAFEILLFSICLFIDLVDYLFFAFVTLVSLFCHNC
jgi:hypothetical protein